MEKNETNALLELLFKTSPHDFQAPVQVTTQMRMALAQAYAIPGFKDYLENAMNKFILSSAIQSDDKFYCGKWIPLTQFAKSLK